MDVTGDRTNVRCCQEQYRIGTWNVRCINQGKLDVVKQEMARVNADILGISKLKDAATGERSYPTSKVRVKSWEDPRPEGQRPRGVTPRPRSGSAAESARLRRRRNSREELTRV